MIDQRMLKILCSHLSWAFLASWALDICLQCLCRNPAMVWPYGAV